MQIDSAPISFDWLIKWQTYLEITALIKSRRWTEDGHLPFEKIAFLDQFDSKSFDRFILKWFEFHCKSPNGRSGWLLSAGSHVCPFKVVKLRKKNTNNGGQFKFQREWNRYESGDRSDTEAVMQSRSTQDSPTIDSLIQLWLLRSRFSIKISKTRQKPTRTHGEKKTLAQWQ